MMKQHQQPWLAPVHTVNVYTAGGLWRMILYYDRNVPCLNVILKWSVRPQVSVLSCVWNLCLMSMRHRWRTFVERKRNVYNNADIFPFAMELDNW